MERHDKRDFSRALCLQLLKRDPLVIVPHSANRTEIDVTVCTLEAYVEALARSKCDDGAFDGVSAALGAEDCSSQWRWRCKFEESRHGWLPAFRCSCLVERSVMVEQVVGMIDLKGLSMIKRGRYERVLCLKHCFDQCPECHQDVTPLIVSAQP